MKQANSHSLWESLFVFLLYVAFAFMAFMIVAIGAGVYSGIRDTGNNNYDVRTSLSFVATQLRQGDEMDQITTQEYMGKNAIVMKETINGTQYETWLYHYEGNLYQLFMESGIDFTPESGEKIMSIEEFDVTFDGEKTFYLSAENKNGAAGSLTVVLRTARKGGTA